MSKFVNKLQSLSKASAAPIGFHPSVSESKRPPMLLIAGLSATEVKEDKIPADADAGLILDEKPDTSVVKQMVESMGEVPLGAFVKDMSEDTMKELVSLGCDFLVFDIKTAATVLQKEEMGKFLMIEPSLDQGFVRAINGLEVDGVFIDIRGDDSFVAVEHLLICRRFVELLEKPVITTLPSMVTNAELTNLWQTGVDGVVSPPAQSIEALIELKKMIGDLPGGARGRRAKADVKLPHYGGFAANEEDEEQEEI